MMLVFQPLLCTFMFSARVIAHSELVSLLWTDETCSAPVGRDELYG